MGISVHRGAPVGGPGGEVHLLGTSRDIKRGLWKQRLSPPFLSVGALQGEYGGRTSLLGILKDV
jgi:hypothetical protein